jgi:hypothetical protein
MLINMLGTGKLPLRDNFWNENENNVISISTDIGDGIELEQYGWPSDFPVVTVGIWIPAKKGKHGQGNSILGIDIKINSLNLQKVEHVENN